MAAENYTGWTQTQSFGSAQTSSRGSSVEIRPGTQEPVPEQCRRARSSGDQGALPLHVEFQVLSDGDHHSGWAGTRAPNSQASIQVWTRQMDFLVAEKTVGYGPCLEFDGTSPRHLNLVPLMHQILPWKSGACAVFVT